MSLSLAFWVLMLLWLVLGAYAMWPFTGANVKLGGSSLILFIVLVLLGWKVFGPPIQG